MQFPSFFGIKNLAQLTWQKYNSDLQTIRQWWNDHDSGVRNWTRSVFGGATDGSSAATGIVGEYLSVLVSASPVNFAATGTFGNIASLSLTPGVWMITGAVGLLPNSCTFSTSSWGLAISIFSGNTTTDQVLDDNQYYFNNYSPNEQSGVIIPRQWIITTTTTFYLKATANYSAGQPLGRGRMTAWRMF